MTACGGSSRWCPLSRVFLVEEWWLGDLFLKDASFLGADFAEVSATETLAGWEFAKPVARRAGAGVISSPSLWACLPLQQPKRLRNFLKAIFLFWVSAWIGLIYVSISGGKNRKRFGGGDFLEIGSASKICLAVFVLSLMEGVSGGPAGVFGCTCLHFERGMTWLKATAPLSLRN